MMFMETQKETDTRIRLERVDYHLSLFRDAWGDGSDKQARHMARLHLKEVGRELKAGRTKKNSPEPAQPEAI